MPLQYDPTGIDPENLVPEEIHILNQSTTIFPLKKVFFKDGLYLNAVQLNAGVEKGLVYGADYVLSPSYLSVSNALGHEVFTYIVINNKEEWGPISVTYQAIGGGVEDTTLLTQITEAGDFDENDINNWLAFMGEHSTTYDLDSYVGLVNSGPLSLLKTRIEEIIDELGSDQLTFNYNLIRRNTEDESNQNLIIEALTQENTNQDTQLAALYSLITGQPIPEDTVIPTREQIQNDLIEANRLFLNDLRDNYGLDLSALIAQAETNRDTNVAQDVLISENTVSDGLQNQRIASLQSDLDVLQDIPIDTREQEQAIADNAMVISGVSDRDLIAQVVNTEQDDDLSQLLTDITTAEGTIIPLDLSDLIAALALNTLDLTQIIPVIDANVSTNGLQTKEIAEQQQDLYILEHGLGIDLNRLISAASVVQGSADAQVTGVDFNTAKNAEQDLRISKLQTDFSSLPPGVDISALLTLIATNKDAIDQTNADLDAEAAKDAEQDALMLSNQSRIDALIQGGGASVPGLGPLYIRANTNKATLTFGGSVYQQLQENITQNDEQNTKLNSIEQREVLQDTKIAQIKACLDALGVVTGLDPTVGIVDYSIRWQCIVATNPGTDDVFGSAIALSGNGNVLAVGVPAETNLETAFDMVHILDWNAATDSWVERHKLYTTNISTDGAFGGGLAMSDDGLFLAVGSPDWTIGGISVGKVTTYKYIIEASTWVERASITAPDAAEGAKFGSSISMSGDGNIVAVGAPGADSGVGRVYTYDWTYEFVLRNSFNRTFGTSVDDDGFGTSVALINNGAILVTGTASGYVSTFDRSANAWSKRNEFVLTNTAANWTINVAISSGGEVLAVGQRFTGPTTLAEVGAVHIYDRSGVNWVERMVITPVDGVAGDHFGAGLSLSDDTRVLAIGLPRSDVATGNAGRVCFYGLRPGVTSVAYTPAPTTPTHPTPTGPTPTTPTIVASEWDTWGIYLGGAELHNTRFGEAVTLSRSGKVMALGLPGDGNYGESAGAVRVYDLVGNDWIERSFVGVAGVTNGDNFGASVAFALGGELLVVGTPNDSSLGVHKGKVHILDRRTGHNNHIYNERLSAPIPGILLDNSYLGTAVAISEDGIHLAMGAPGTLTETDSFSKQGSVIFMDWDVTENRWLDAGRIEAPLHDGFFGNDFGSALAMNSAGNILVVGGRYTGNDGNGAVITYDKQSNGQWVERNVLTYVGYSNYTGDFGSSLSLSDTGDFLLVGDQYGGAELPVINTNIYPRPGTSHLYERTGDTWNYVKELIPTTPIPAASRYGCAVSLVRSGETAAITVRHKLVGSGSNTFETGSVYFYGEHPNGVPTQTVSVDVGTTTNAGFPIFDTLDATAGQVANGYGEALSFSANGQRLAVGVRSDRTYGFNAGVVYIYNRVGNQWVFDTTVISSSVTEGDAFGTSVALNNDGTLLVVGAEYTSISADASDKSVGVVYIFNLTGENWTETTTLHAGVHISFHLFGSAVAVTGDGTMIVVGARSGGYSGIVYTFTLNTSTQLWTGETTIADPTTNSNSDFGSALAMSDNGSILAVGAPLGGTDHNGAVYSYNRANGTDWIHRDDSDLQLPVTHVQGYKFGSSVCLSADGVRLGVGSEAYVRNYGSIVEGNFNLYQQSALDWGETHTLIPDDLVHYGKYGSGVAMTNDGETVVVGGSAQGTSRVGKLYFFGATI